VCGITKLQVIFECSIACWLLVAGCWLLLLFCLAGSYESRKLNFPMVRRLQGGIRSLLPTSLLPAAALQAALRGRQATQLYAPLLFGVALSL
jgi:hypothetical protein